MSLHSTLLTKISNVVLKWIACLVTSQTLLHDLSPQSHTNPLTLVWCLWIHCPRTYCTDWAVSALNWHTCGCWELGKGLTMVGKEVQPFQRASWEWKALMLAVIMKCMCQPHGLMTKMQSLHYWLQMRMQRALNHWPSKKQNCAQIGLSGRKQSMQN